MNSFRYPRRCTTSLAAAALLVPTLLHAQDCGSVANFASNVWDRYIEEAREAGCLSPIQGPRKYVACSIRSYANTLHILDRMVGWWNRMADGSWATVGPRRLDPGWQEGTLLGTSGRLWMGTAPVNTDEATIEIEKLGGVVPTEVVVCASKDDGSTREIGRYRFEVGRDNVGRTRTFSFPDLEAELLSVRVDGKGAIPTNKFEYRIRLTTEPHRYELGPVPGFADLHVHQAAQLGFGGNQLWGNHIGPLEEALIECGPATIGGELVRSLPLPRVNTLHGIVPFNMKLGEGEARHGAGAPTFGAWPHFNDVLHQQVHENWLKDAHDRGLNLVVVSAVNFEGLCYLLKALYPRPNDRMGCRDMENVVRQIEAFIDMDERRDWYEIAMDPWHARKIIHDGNLAVVISMEVSHLFPLDEGPAVTQLDRLYGMGLRTLQLAHETDSRYAGAAPHRDLFELFQTLKWPTADPGRAFAAARGDLMATWGFAYDSQGKNVVGLRPAGRDLADAMIDRHMLIDVAHLSERAVRDLYDFVASEHDYYPLYNSHTRFKPLLTLEDREKQQEFLTTEEQLRYIRETGGMVGLRTGQNTILSSSEGAPDAVANTCFGSSRSFAQMVHYGKRAGVQMAIGSDLNGFINQLGPRFGPDGCPAAGDRRAEQIAAQLEGPRSPCLVPTQGGGGYGGGFDTDGLRHIGYLPDLIADLETIETPGTEVLKSSAEAFLRMWERAWDPERQKIDAETDLASQVADAIPDWSACGVLSDLQGNWIRVGGNNPPNNGMRIRIEGDRARLTSMPSTGVGGFQPGQVLWTEIAVDGTLQVLGSDGRYYLSELSMDGSGRFDVDVDRANSPGNDQTWERAPPSIEGTWVRQDVGGSPDDGLQVLVEGGRGVIRYLPASATKGLRTGAILWRNFGPDGTLEVLVGRSRYESARMILEGNDQLMVTLESGGTQTWVRRSDAKRRPR